jgi:type IV secretory pathway TrbL component
MAIHAHSIIWIYAAIVEMELTIVSVELVLAMLLGFVELVEVATHKFNKDRLGFVD